MEKISKFEIANIVMHLVIFAFYAGGMLISFPEWSTFSSYGIKIIIIYNLVLLGISFELLRTKQVYVDGNDILIKHLVGRKKRLTRKDIIQITVDEIPRLLELPSS